MKTTISTRQVTDTYDRIAEFWHASPSFNGPTPAGQTAALPGAVGGRGRAPTLRRGARSRACGRGAGRVPCRAPGRRGVEAAEAAVERLQRSQQQAERDQGVSDDPEDEPGGVPPDLVARPGIAAEHGAGEA